MLQLKNLFPYDEQDFTKRKDTYKIEKLKSQEAIIDKCKVLKQFVISLSLNVCCQERLDIYNCMGSTFSLWS